MFIDEPEEEKKIEIHVQPRPPTPPETNNFDWLTVEYIAEYGVPLIPLIPPAKTYKDIVKMKGKGLNQK